MNERQKQGDGHGRVALLTTNRALHKHIDLNNALNDKLMSQHHRGYYLDCLQKCIHNNKKLRLMQYNVRGSEGLQWIVVQSWLD